MNLCRLLQWPSSARRTILSLSLYPLVGGVRRTMCAYSARPPSLETTVYERGAVSVTDTTDSGDPASSSSAAHQKHTPYLDLIRETHDPSQHVKTIEDELKGTIGKALGRQGEKILYHTARMQQELDQYRAALMLLQQHQATESATTSTSTATTADAMDTTTTTTANIVQAAAQQYNTHRQSALKARWELTVHRQAAGFIVQNQKYVADYYPISSRELPETVPKSSLAHENDNDNTNDTMADNKQEKERPPKKFGDQLDWWQNIGRWK